MTTITFVLTADADSKTNSYVPGAEHANFVAAVKAGGVRPGLSSYIECESGDVVRGTIVAINLDEPGELRLPEIPASAIGLIVKSDEGDDVRFYREGHGWVRGPKDVCGIRKLGQILDMYGPARVEMPQPRVFAAPPEQPADLKAVRDAEGLVWTPDPHDSWLWVSGDESPLLWAVLLTRGPLTEAAGALGDTEPGPEVTHVLTAAGRTWRRNANTEVGGWFNEDDRGTTWARLYRTERPLVDVTPKEG